MAEPTDWLDRFEPLAGMTAADRAVLTTHGHPVTLPAGAAAFRAGDAAGNFLLVLEGCVRVQLVSPGGREVVLYRVGGGETCVLTTATVLGGGHYDAEGIVERPTRAIALPTRAFSELLARSEPFRAFVFATYGARLTEIMLRLQEIAFDSIDRRLARHLLERMRPCGTVALTHQELATELGTAREVVTRHLKELVRRGWVEVGRGSLKVLDARAIRSQADSGPL